MTVKRFTPRKTPYAEMIALPDGEYVRHEDYAALELHNEYLLARLRKQGEQLEAIGAGGVSARRITSTPSNASAKITERSQAYLDSNLDSDEHAAFISWAREAHDYPEYARLILDSEWCQGAVAGWQGAIKADRQQHENEWKLAIDHELVTMQSTADCYSTAREAVSALIDWHVAVATDPVVSGEQRGGAIAWESKTHVFRKFVTDSTYQRFSTEAKKWYKPYKCSSCEASQAKQCGEPVAWQYFDGTYWTTTIDPDGHAGAGRKIRPLYTAPQPDTPAQEPSDDEIREVFLTNGFTIKPGHDDLKQYVYDAARALLTRYGQSGEPEGWKLVPVEPTKEMRDVITSGIRHDHMVSVYQDMLAAAPEPPCTL